MLNQLLRVSTGTCEEFVANAVKTSNISGFWLSQSSAATCCRCGGNLCDMYI